MSAPVTENNMLIHHYCNSCYPYYHCDYHYYYYLHLHHYCHQYCITQCATIGNVEPNDNASDSSQYLEPPSGTIGSSTFAQASLRSFGRWVVTDTCSEIVSVTMPTTKANTSIPPFFLERSCNSHKMHPQLFKISSGGRRNYSLLVIQTIGGGRQDGQVYSVLAIQRSRIPNTRTAVADPRDKR